MVKLIQAAKTNFARDKLESASPCDMFRVVRGLTTCPVRTLTRESEKALAEELLQFFHLKVINIRAVLDDADCVSQRDPTLDTGVDVGCQLSSFTLVSEVDLRRLISKSSSKSCHLDPEPTWLEKDNVVLDAVLPILLSAINRSLESGAVPASLQSAVVTPMLKKEGLDREILSNYHPVSNLSFVSKFTWGGLWLTS